MTERTARLDELLREEISRVVARDVHDPRIGFVTVTHVDVAPDLRTATVWVSFIGQPQERKESLRALQRAMPYVRRQLGVLRLRRIPELRVKVDETADRGTRVLSILRELEEGDGPDSAGSPEPDETLPTPNRRTAEAGESDGDAAREGDGR